MTSDQDERSDAMHNVLLGVAMAIPRGVSSDLARKLAEALVAITEEKNPFPHDVHFIAMTAANLLLDYAVVLDDERITWLKSDESSTTE